MKNVYPFPGTYIEIDDDGNETEVIVLRCESRKREGKRSWRCDYAAGHRHMHANHAGGRRWY